MAVISSDGFTRFLAISRFFLPTTHHKMKPYIPNKHLNTPQRIHIINRNVMLEQTTSKIKLIINSLISTIKRTLKSKMSRYNKNPTSKTLEKINARDLKSLIRTITNSQNEYRQNYIFLIVDLKIHISKFIIRKFLRKVDFRRCILYFKSLIS